jgi:hypothetical protein
MEDGRGKMEAKTRRTEDRRRKAEIRGRPWGDGRNCLETFYALAPSRLATCALRVTVKSEVDIWLVRNIMIVRKYFL